MSTAMKPISTTPVRGAAWLLALLTLLNILNFADRYVMVAFSTSIVPELHMSNFEFGLMTGFVFLTVYMVVGIVAGSLADRRHRPRLIAAGLALWSALTAVSGMAHNFVQMAAARVFIGVGEASLTPAAASLIADAYPPARRALPFGIFYWGIPVGIGGAYIFASIAGPRIGWRGSFFLLGAVGILLALLLLLLRDLPRGRFDDPEGHVSPERIPSNLLQSLSAVWQLAKENPAFALTLTGACATTFVQGSTVLDLLWWVKERGYMEDQAQEYSGSLFLFGGLIGGVLGGVGGDIARRLTPAGDLRFLAWAFIVTIPMTIAYRYVAPATPLFYLLGFGGCMLFMLYYGPISSSLQEQVPAELRGAATGVIVVLTTLSAAIGAAFVGFLADLFERWGDETPITYAIRMCQTVGLVSIPCFLVAAHLMRERLIAGHAPAASTLSSAH